ncbi:histidinol-phosphate aminotransferase [Marinithermofilum abyssi]|uniref:Histidinol-phosphate aminotransferase n=1 Tax=Marinithermofilum abyssi TaxID=1571185 RepID=A0A8J2VHQ2_9BACL|nr:histidinol-phosphate transaminase [Marinithermofilum abyssi]GGE24040.1 histidinol-phosphate aminotransferase [Marinithermofilum abyssi]
MTKTPKFSRIVEALPPTVPFVPPEEMERQFGRKVILRLGANESSFGLSPKARAAMEQAAEESYLYGDATSHELRTKLAARLGIGTQHLVIGSGIDELLGLIARAFLDPGSGVTTSEGGYPTFNYHVEGYGGVLHTVPYRSDFYNDLDGLARSARETRSRLVYLANPDNPTGTFYTADEIARFRKQLPSDCLLILDEAYVEFAPEDQIYPIDPDDPQVIRTRTFSKAYGMAGARIGYAIAHPEIVQVFEKIRNHFGVNRMAQAGAAAALEDVEFLRQVVQGVKKGRQEYEELARKTGVRAIPSHTNFVAIDAGSKENAQALLEALWKQGVFVRAPQAAPLHRCIRVTIGTPEERRQFAAVFEKIMQTSPTS